MKNFIEKNFNLIVLVIAVLGLLKGCGDRRELSKLRREVESIKDSTYTKSELNKELKIEGIEQFPNNTIEVYNRYGNLVWSGINYNNVTNTFKGMANVSGVVSKGSYLPTGTYFFILSYPNDCEKTELKGFIHIDNKF